jgi:PPOX class probable FMN-dependent enzyme
MQVETKDAHQVADRATLRELIGAPQPLVIDKEMARLDAHCRHFLSLSTILFISSVGADGRADVSPRGDAPGFIRVIDDRTIAIPDRPGNRRVDTMSNITGNPEQSVGLIFLVPGVDEVMRASGRAQVMRDPALLAEMAANGKVPKLAIVIALDEVYFHCGKALKRARLWDPAMRIARNQFPSMAQLVLDQRRPPKTIDELEHFVAENYKNELY